MRRCIVSVGVGGRFPLLLNRMKESLAGVGETAARHLYDQWPNDCPTHGQVPFGFKPWAMCRARADGYDQVLWLDSSVFANRSLAPFWDALTVRGWFMLGDAWNCGQWTTDACLGKLGVTREQAWDMRMILAGIVGLDFRFERANQLLDLWHARSRDGVSFHGPARAPEQLGAKALPETRIYYGHRHDQSVASILAHQLGMDLEKMDRFWISYEPQGPNDSLFNIASLSAGCADHATAPVRDAAV